MNFCHWFINRCRKFINQWHGLSGQCRWLMKTTDGCEECISLSDEISIDSFGLLSWNLVYDCGNSLKNRRYGCKKKAFTIYLKEICIIFATSSWPSGVWWDLDIKKKAFTKRYRLRSNFATLKPMKMITTTLTSVLYTCHYCGIYIPNGVGGCCLSRPRHCEGPTIG